MQKAVLAEKGVPEGCGTRLGNKNLTVLWRPGIWML